MFNFDFIQTLIENYNLESVEQCISPNDKMNNQHYFGVGKSAAWLVVMACMASSRISQVNRVLDLPCGHGRVLRHLVQLFPNAKFDACDLNEDGVDFCSSTFGANPIYSTSELTNIDFNAEYDLIWVGSLFTHTNREITRRWMTHLAKFLTPTGIIVATLHGRWSEHRHAIRPYIREESWEKVLAGYLSTGYGYCNYGAEFISSPTSDYGVSLVKPHATIKDIENIPGTRIYLYQERGWADHQDVVVFGRPSYDAQHWV
jgi:SAM-dependent methyltransferase